MVLLFESRKYYPFMWFAQLRVTPGRPVVVRAIGADGVVICSVYHMCHRMAAAPLGWRAVDVTPRPFL